MSFFQIFSSHTFVQICIPFRTRIFHFVTRTPYPQLPIVALREACRAEISSRFLLRRWRWRIVKINKTEPDELYLADPPQKPIINTNIYSRQTRDGRGERKRKGERESERTDI